MKMLIIVIILLLASCGKINQLYDQINSAIAKLNDLTGNISADGLLGFDSLSFDFGQIEIGTSAEKKIHINNLYLDNLTLIVDDSSLKSPVFLESNSCVNVAYQGSCDIVLKLNGVQSFAQTISQVIKINGVSLSITGSIVASTSNNTTDNVSTNNSDNNSESFLLNPVDESVFYGMLESGKKYKAVIYVTNISKNDMSILSDLLETVDGVSISGCENGLLKNDTCSLLIKIDTTIMALGKYSIPVSINSKRKVLNFEVIKPRFR